MELVRRVVGLGVLVLLLLLLAVLLLLPIGLLSILLARLLLGWLLGLGLLGLGLLGRLLGLGLLGRLLTVLLGRLLLTVLLGRLLGLGLLGRLLLAVLLGRLLLTICPHWLGCGRVHCGGHHLGPGRGGLTRLLSGSAGGVAHVLGCGLHLSGGALGIRGQLLGSLEEVLDGGAKLGHALVSAQQHHTEHHAQIEHQLQQIHQDGDDDVPNQGDLVEEDDPEGVENLDHQVGRKAEGYELRPGLLLHGQKTCQQPDDAEHET